MYYNTFTDKLYPPLGRFYINDFGFNDSFISLCKSYLKAGGKLTLNTDIFDNKKLLSNSTLPVPLTPFQEVKLCLLRECFKAEYKNILDEPILKISEQNFIIEYITALKVLFITWFKITKETETVVFCSSGYDSQLILSILTMLREEGHLPSRGLSFICRPPEEKEFLAIMTGLNWDPSYYGIQNETQDDPYGLTDPRKGSNGWCPKPYILNFPNVENIENKTIILGNYGEMAKYILKYKNDNKPFLCENINLHKAISMVQPYYLIREAYYRSIAKNLLLPYLSYNSLACWHHLDLKDSKYYHVLAAADSVRLAAIEKIGLIKNPCGVAYKTKPPKWNWNVSKQRQDACLEQFKNSILFREYLNGKLPYDFSPFDEKKMWGWDGHLLAFAQSLDQIYSNI